MKQISTKKLKRAENIERGSGIVFKRLRIVPKNRTTIIQHFIDNSVEARVQLIYAVGLFDRFKE